MIITISGLPGSGKGTVGKRVAKALGYKYLSVGDMLGEIATDMGISIAELLKRGETDPSADHKVDEYQKRLGREKDNLVVDSRLGWHFIPHSFKVYIKVNIEEGARRIMGDLDNRPDEAYTSPEDAMGKLRQRIESEKTRYIKMYNRINPHDEKHYDYILDTTSLTIEEATETLLARIREELAAKRG